MRCLRSIGDAQNTGHIYLSQENIQILDDELQQNFRVTLDDVTKTGGDRLRVQIHVNQPPIRIKLKRERKMYNVREKSLTPGTSLNLREVETDEYQLTHTLCESLDPSDRFTTSHDISDFRAQRIFSHLTLVAEISPYLNKSPLDIEAILDATAEGVEGILSAVNEFNELLYDEVIPRLFNELFDVQEFTHDEEYEVELIKQPDDGFYEMSALKKLIVRSTDTSDSNQTEKSFHLDVYCFDSTPEKQLFWDLLKEGRVKKLYFTGMLTHGQSDFYIQYIDPDSHAIRSYYPDFLIQKEDGSYVIIEVKGDHQVEDPVVQAKKEFAEQTAVASGMTYEIIKGTDATAHRYQSLFTPTPRPSQPGILSS